MTVKKGRTKIFPLFYNSFWLLLLATVNQQISDLLAPNQGCFQNIFIQHGLVQGPCCCSGPGELAASHLSSSCLPHPAHKGSCSSSGRHSWQHQALRTLNHDNHLPPGVLEAELGQILAWAVNKEWSMVLEKELQTLTASLWQELISQQQKTPKTTLFQTWIHGNKLIPSITPLPSTEIH